MKALGRYLLFDEIAKGGMASVHLGRLSGPIGFSRTVAIKRLHPHIATDPEFVAMFVDEARLAARIRHPNVVPTIDVVTDSNEVFIVMEYMFGATVAHLSRILKGKNERYPVRYTLATIAGALHGLHAAHEVTDEAGHPLGIVHRDVSPQNIFIGTDGVSRVLDFGIAKAAGRLAETGDAGSIKGKIAYMAPEQISSGMVNRKADIYAAAVVLWELLAGQRLFDAETDAARGALVLWATANGQIDPPSKHNPDVSPEVDAIVLRGLGPADKRWDTAQDMAIAIESNGGLVPTTEIGAWVSKVYSAELERRSARLKEIEASTKSTPSLPVSSPSIVEEGTPANTSASIRSERSRPWLVPLLLFIGLAIGFLGWRLGRAPAPPGPATVVTVVAAPPPGPAPAPAPAPTDSSVGTPSSVSAIVSAAPSHVAAPVAKAPKGPVTAPAAKPPKQADDCDPPYTIDAENHKIYKRQCMGK